MNVLRPRFWRMAATISVVLLAAVLRFAHLRERALDNDEIAEATWSSKAFGDMMKEVRRDAVHPPEDYVVQFVVGRVGPEWVRRLPSVIAGISTVALVILLGRWWISSVAGLSAGLFLSVSPMHVFYSQQVRPYSTALFYTVASLCALEWFAKTRRSRWGFAWFVLVFLSGATLYFSGMIAVLAGVCRIFIDRKEALRQLWLRLPVTILSWTILYAPWFAVVRNASRIEPPSPRASLGWLWWRWHLQSLGVGSDRTWEAVSLPSWVFWGLVAAGVIASVQWRLLRVATLTFIVGTAFEIGLLQIHPHYPAVRYLMPSWILSFFLAGAAVDLLMGIGSYDPSP